MFSCCLEGRVAPVAGLSNRLSSGRGQDCHCAGAEGAGQNSAGCPPVSTSPHSPHPPHTVTTLWYSVLYFCTALHCTALALPQATPPHNPLFIVLFSPRTIRRPKLSNSRRRCRQPLLPVSRTRHTDSAGTSSSLPPNQLIGFLVWLKVSLHL